MAKPAKRIKNAAAAYVPQSRDAVMCDIRRIVTCNAKRHDLKRR